MKWMTYLAAAALSFCGRLDALEIPLVNADFAVDEWTSEEEFIQNSGTAQVSPFLAGWLVDGLVRGYNLDIDGDGDPTIDSGDQSRIWAGWQQGDGLRQVGFQSFNDAENAIWQDVGSFVAGTVYEFSAQTGPGFEGADQNAFLQIIRASDGTLLSEETFSIVQSGNSVSETQSVLYLATQADAGSAIRVRLGTDTGGSGTAVVSNPSLTETPFVEVPSLFVQVDATYGEVRLINNTADTYDIVGYELTSTQGAFNAAGYVSLEEQDRADFPAGDGSGNGWEVAGTPDANFLSERNLLSSSTLVPNAQLTLGSAYDVVGDHRDVTLDLLLADNSVLPVNTIVYNDSPDGLPGDYNNSQTVDLADYTVWRDSLGVSVAVGSGADGNLDGLINQADYAIWRAFFGATGLASLSAVSVPEPANCPIAFMASCLAASIFRYRGGPPAERSVPPK